jgi:hypothetical protein
MPSVITVLGVLKGDSDPRVQQEATEALARLAPSQVPMRLDSAVQPAGVVLPARGRHHVVPLAILATGAAAA